MRNMIELSKIDGRREHNPFAESDDPTENGGVANANEPTIKAMVNATAIRCFYPRKNDAPGTRITFTDGGGFAVAEPYDEVKRLIAELPEA